MRGHCSAHWPGREHRRWLGVSPPVVWPGWQSRSGPPGVVEWGPAWSWHSQRPYGTAECQRCPRGLAPPPSGELPCRPIGVVFITHQTEENGHKPGGTTRTCKKEHNPFSKCFQTFSIPCPNEQDSVHISDYLLRHLREPATLRLWSRRMKFPSLDTHLKISFGYLLFHKSLHYTT